MAFEHIKETWNHVLSGDSTTTEKLEFALEVVAGGAIATGLARLGLSGLAFQVFEEHVARAEHSRERKRRSGKIEVSTGCTARPRTWSPLDFHPDKLGKR